MMDELTRIALVGTSRHPANLDADHPAEALAATIAGEDREHAFLLRAGARALFDHCGRAPKVDVAALLTTPAESLPHAPAAVIGLLEKALGDESRELLGEYLAALIAAQLILPPELLPRALRIDDAALRRQLLPVLGERGRWLSALNAEWKWVTAGVASLAPREQGALRQQWEEGNIAERCQALAALRASEPTLAREWLAGIDKEKADHRARMLEALATNLSLDDEPLLEARLADRSEQVRRVAAGLLGRLPGSALAARMRERADAMLTLEKSGMLRKKLKLHCRPPEEIGAAWERDGIPAQAGQGQGRRALWAESVLATVPPSHWSQRFEVEPAALVAAIAADDFADAVFNGWSRAAATFAPHDPPTVRWLRPLWDYWLDLALNHRGSATQRIALEQLQALITALPDAERALMPLLGQTNSEPAADLLVLLASLPRPWSEAFARAHLAAVRETIARGNESLAYAWSQTLSVAALATPSPAFAAALEPCDMGALNPDKGHTRAVISEFQKFQEAIQARQAFYQALTK